MKTAETLKKDFLDSFFLFCMHGSQAKAVPTTTTREQTTNHDCSLYTQLQENHMQIHSLWNTKHPSDRKDGGGLVEINHPNVIHHT